MLLFKKKNFSRKIKNKKIKKSCKIYNNAWRISLSLSLSVGVLGVFELRGLVEPIYLYLAQVQIENIYIRTGKL